MKKQVVLIDDYEAFENLCNLFDVVNVNVSRETLKGGNENA